MTEQDLKQSSNRIVFKGTLDGGDYCAMTAHEYVEHIVAEKREKQKMALQKLANNPAFSEDVRTVLWQAVYDVDTLKFLYDACDNLREKYMELRGKQ